MLNNLKSKVRIAVAFAVAFYTHTHHQIVKWDSCALPFFIRKDKCRKTCELDSYRRNIMHVRKFRANPKNFVPRKWNAKVTHYFLSLLTKPNTHTHIHTYIPFYLKPNFDLFCLFLFLSLFMLIHDEGWPSFTTKFKIFPL